jgi:4-amino-4-deoxy-L-arabinose transferase-like glycosyltransferase
MINQKYLIALMGLLAFFSLASLPFNALQPDDASMYALTIKNTVQHNQWLLPLLQPGDPGSFLDKPLLGIWLQALPLAFFQVIDVPIKEITVHIPNAIYYLVLLTVFYYFLKKEKGDPFALMGTFILATALAVLIYSRTPKLDILLTFSITMAQFYLYQFWNDQKTWKPFCFWVGVGFLIKSGFALIFCGLTFLSLFLIDVNFRDKFFKFFLQKEFYVGLSFFLMPVIILMGLPYLAAPAQYFYYLKSVLWQSKYNLSYLGLGMHWNVLGYAFLAFFPWTIFLFNKNYYVADQKKSIEKFSLIWILSNILFLFLFYQQNDLRTFVSLMPPLAVLAAGRFVQTNAKKTGTAIAALFLTFVLLTQISVLLNSPALFSLFFWMGFLLMIAINSFKPNQIFLHAALTLLLIGHVGLLF